MRFAQRALLFAAASACTPVALAQAPCPCPEPTPEPVWKGSLGAGVAANSGNSDTQSYSFSFGASHDPKRRNIVKLDGLYLRASNQGETIVDKTSAGARDEYGFGKRAYAFGEVRYLRDLFKDLNYLVSPLVGAGYRLVETQKLQLSLDGAVGGAFEKLASRDATASGALKAGQALVWKLSSVATLSQGASGLWKMDDFGDAFYHFELAVASTMSKRTELKLTFVRDYKSRPADPSLKKRDDAIVAALVFKL
jgi:putative salt-induced outer membrane protein YdiY